MNRISERKIILIKRHTRLDNLIARFNSISQAKFYVEHLGADFHDYELEHKEYYIAVSHLSDILNQLGSLQILERDYISNFIFGKDDLVVALGQDGMVANILKYLDGQPLVGINPSPSRWDGVLLPFLVKDIECVGKEIIQNKRTVKEVTMGETSLNNGQKLLAVNDFYVGQKTHVSSRYTITVNEKTEQQSSSGIIVSTGLGSTGWFKSVIAGARGVITGLCNQNKAKSELPVRGPFDWDSEYLFYSVREPFPSNATGANLVFGKVTKEEPLLLVSNMSENGVIFSDGIEHDFLEFNSGVQATIGVAEKKGLLVL